MSKDPGGGRRSRREARWPRRSASIASTARHPSGCRPASRNGPLRRGEQLAQPRHVGRRRDGSRRGCQGSASAHSAGSRSMSSGSASTTGPGRPDGRAWKARLMNSGMRLGVVDLRHPFGELAEHAAVVELLERLALERRAPPGRQQDQRRRILDRDVNAGAGVGGAGAARHDADAGLAGELAVRLRHDAAPPSWRQVKVRIEFAS